MLKMMKYVESVAYHLGSHMPYLLVTHLSLKDGKQYNNSNNNNNKSTKAVTQIVLKGLNF